LVLKVTLGRSGAINLRGSTLRATRKGSPSRSRRRSRTTSWTTSAEAAGARPTC
jgi:hypothetical protein